MNAMDVCYIRLVLQNFFKHIHLPPCFRYAFVLGIIWIIAVLPISAKINFSKVFPCIEFCAALNSTDICLVFLYGYKIGSNAIYTTHLDGILLTIENCSVGLKIFGLVIFLKLET